ncbi:MAG: VWA domain-containing protein [Acidobacteriota bacterium]
MVTRSAIWCLTLALYVAGSGPPGRSWPVVPATFPATSVQQRSLDKRPVYGAEVEMVTLNVAVLDSKGVPVAGLTKEDFTLFEDGVEQQIALLLAPQDAPLDIAMGLDFSGSIGRDAPYARDVAIAFLEALSAEDCVYVLPFNTVVGPGRWGGPGDPHLRTLIEQAPQQGNTALFDAMLKGFSELRSTAEDELQVAEYTAFGLPGGKASASGVEPAPAGQQGGNAAVPLLLFQASDGCGAPLSDHGGRTSTRRRAMVVLTDGLDNRSVTSLAGALEATHEAGLPVFPISAGAAVQPAVGGFRPFLGGGALEAMRRARKLEAQWRELARISGGELIKGKGSSSRLDRAYNEALNLLRASYLIGYHPPSLASADTRSEELTWHELEVKLGRPKLRALTRPGYFRSAADSKGARAAVHTGVELLESGRADLAVVEFDRALRADARHWQAHYHRAIALGLLDRWPEAQEASERAAALNPGFARVQELAWLTAYHVGDYQLGWEHAIRARQAGAEMREEFELLRQHSPAPADLKDRLDAPRIMLRPSEIPDLEVQAALKKVYRALQRAVADSPRLALVADVRLAEYLLVIDDEELRDKRPRRLKGRLELYDRSGDRVYRKSLNLHDIDDQAALAAALEKYTADLAARLPES